MLPVLAPEMDTIADELFAMITSAGIRAGVTLRPQIITPNPNWNSSCPPNRPPWPYYQKKLLLPNKQPDEDAIFANLQRKANYAIKRWSISVFYVRISVLGQHPFAYRNGVQVDSTGFPLVSVWDRLRTVFPVVVFIPEQSGPLDYASVTPLQDDWNGVPIVHQGDLANRVQLPTDAGAKLVCDILHRLLHTKLCARAIVNP